MAENCAKLAALMGSKVTITITPFLFLADILSSLGSFVQQRGQLPKILSPPETSFRLHRIRLTTLCYSKRKVSLSLFLLINYLSQRLFHMSGRRFRCQPHHVVKAIRHRFPGKPQLQCHSASSARVVKKFRPALFYQFGNPLFNFELTQGFCYSNNFNSGHPTPTGVSRLGFPIILSHV